MLDRVFSAFARLTPVHVARTEEERRAVFRMRYRIYFEEKNELGVPYADHARREIHTPEDDSPQTALFYVGSPEDMKGSLRVVAWKPGQIPADFRRKYSLDRFPDIDTRAVCYVGFLMVEKTLRGTAGVVALTSGAVEKTVVDHGAEMMFSDCAPGLLNPYRRLGLRPYGGRLLSMHRGMQIPVAGITADLDHARRVGSPWYPTLKKLAAQHKLPARDFSALLVPFGHPGVETDVDRVQAAIEGSVGRHQAPFLAQFPPKIRRRLAQGGMIVDVDPDVDMLVEGFANKDIFVVLEGELEIRMGGSVVAKLGPGEVLGEIAFFRGSGQRSATVRSTTRGSVLHVRHGFLSRLASEHPAEALPIYEALGRLVAERLAAWGPEGRRTSITNEIEAGE